MSEESKNIVISLMIIAIVVTLASMPRYWETVGEEDNDIRWTKITLKEGECYAKGVGIFNCNEYDGIWSEYVSVWHFNN